MPITLMELRQASQLAERLDRVLHDLQVLKKARGGQTLTISLTPDQADFNRLSIGGDLSYEPSVSQYLELLEKEKASLEKELAAYGVGPR